jgi:hypothetical protein
MCFKNINGIALGLLSTLELLLINGVLSAPYIAADIRNGLLGFNYTLFLAFPVQEHVLVHCDGGVGE